MPNAVHINTDNTAMVELNITPTLREAMVEWFSTHDGTRADYMLHEHVLAELKFAVLVGGRGPIPPYYIAHLLTGEVVYLMRALRLAAFEWRSATSRSGGASRFAERNSGDMQRTRNLVRVAEQLASAIEECSNS